MTFDEWYETSDLKLGEIDNPEIAGLEKAAARQAWRAALESQEGQWVSTAQDLVSAMETCHICKGLLVLQEEANHCEDCSYDCEAHEGEECTPIYELHRRLKALLPSPPSASEEPK